MMDSHLGSNKKCIKNYDCENGACKENIKGYILQNSSEACNFYNDDSCDCVSIDQ